MIVCEKEINNAIAKEFKSAKEQHGLFASLHEAYAVTLEELEEVEKELDKCKTVLDFLWRFTKEDDTKGAIYEFTQLCDFAEHLAQEACQVAAMAVKAHQSFLNKSEVNQNG